MYSIRNWCFCLWADSGLTATRAVYVIHSSGKMNALYYSLIIVAKECESFSYQFYSGWNDYRMREKLFENWCCYNTFRAQIWSSHLIITVKRSPLLWLHKKSRLLQQENVIKGNVFLYLIGVYLKDRTSHSRLVIWNFFSSVEKYFTSVRTVKPPCSTTFRKRTFTESTEIFPVKVL